MYHVFQTAPGKLDMLAPLLSENVKVINTTGLPTIEDIQKALALHGWRGENWYGSTAATAEGALREAISAGFSYRSPQEMGDMEARVSEFGLPALKN